MSLVLKPNQSCPYLLKCPYNNSKLNQGSFCPGSDSNRTTEFFCEFVDDNGIINEGKFRSQYDTTGKMKVILE